MKHKVAMSLNNHLLLRQWTMLRLIPRAPRKITASELLSGLEREGFVVTKRTIERDLQSISAMFPLISDERNRPFGWSWTKDAPTLDLPSLSVSEALTLKLAQDYLVKLMPKSMLESISGHFLAADKVLNQASETNQLANWVDKIATTLPTQSLMTPEIKPGILETIQEAIIKNKALEILYTNQSQALNQYASEAKIHPLGIVLRGQVTYLVCTYDGYTDTRMLSVHRINQATMLDEALKRAEDFKLSAYVNSGAFGFNVAENIVFKGMFTKESAQHLFETPLNQTQKIEIYEEHYLVTATIQDSMQFRWWLLSFGKSLDIKAPASLRSWIKDHATTMQQQYSQD